jgi:predicted nucleic acid-binding protein
MAERLLLDSGPLGKLAHPHPNVAIAIWFQRTLDEGHQIVIPEIADYEVRRSLLLNNLSRSVERLNELSLVLTYLPLDTAMYRRAAELWAHARNTGTPAAHRFALDGDMLLAAQAEAIDGIVITENPTHISLFVPIRNWR